MNSINTSKKTTGLVLGKFLPPHRGHVYLIEFAKRYVDQLIVVVDSLVSQPISGEQRVSWLREMFPSIQVLGLGKENPQEPDEHPDFWDIWRDSLWEVAGREIDFLFASESYGVRLAEVLKTTFVPVDLGRYAIPVSGTLIRESPMKYWDYLPRTVRPHFVKRVCIFGPESTGKSTLTKSLATHFNTVFVPEYARTHLEHRNGEISFEDIPRIARGQQASEDALALEANRLLFCDTDLITTTIWSDVLFNSCHDWISENAIKRQYALYLVLDVDVPWVKDEVRYLPDERQSFFGRCVHELEAQGRNFRIVRGNWDARWKTAVKAVSELLDSTF